MPLFRFMLSWFIPALFWMELVYANDVLEPPPFWSYQPLNLPPVSAQSFKSDEIPLTAEPFKPEIVELPPIPPSSKSKDSDKPIDLEGSVILDKSIGSEGIGTPLPDTSSTPDTVKSAPALSLKLKLENKHFEPEMVAIPAGSFTMGCKKGRDDIEGACYGDEKPPHEVRISEFQLAKTEVTVAQFSVFVAMTGYKTTAEEKGSCWSWVDGWKEIKGNSWRKLGFEQSEDHPVACVSWDDASAYANWLKKETGKHYRLPTEAEWEYSVRGGKDEAYSWGQKVSHEYANYGNEKCCAGLVSGKDQWTYTSPVGSFEVQSYDLNDMNGNVWEWVSDWQSAYATDPLVDPKGASSGIHRVMRGGSWSSSQQRMRSASRDGIAPNLRFNYVGFRLAQD